MKILFPWNNAGCLGFRITKNLYFDIFKRWKPWWQFGLFISIEFKKTYHQIWFNIPQFTIYKHHKYNGPNKIV